MSVSAKIVRARQLQALAIRRELDPSEIQEAMELIEKLTEEGEQHGAAWAYDAIRRTYRRKKNSERCLPLRSIERSANALLSKQKSRSRAPSEEVVGKKDSFDFRKVDRLEKRIRANRNGNPR